MNIYNDRQHKLFQIGTKIKKKRNIKEINFLTNYSINLILKKK